MLDFGAAFRIHPASRYAESGETGYEESGKEGQGKQIVKDSRGSPKDVLHVELHDFQGAHNRREDV
jgi:hypothetical protein